MKQDLDVVLEKERIEAFEVEQAKWRNAALRSGGVDLGIYPGIDMDFGGGSDGG